MSDCEEVYEVEKILRKRINSDSTVQYLIKWVGYGDEDNTWEPDENIESRELVEEFEKNQDKVVEDKRKKKQTKSNKQTNRNSSRRSSHQLTPSSSKSNLKSVTKSPTLENEKKECGFDEGLTIKEILGCTNNQESEEIKFLCRWEERDEAELIPVKILREKAPEKLIDFLLPKIHFLSDAN